MKKDDQMPMDQSINYNDSRERYFAEVANHDLLSFNEEVDLFTRLQNGDEKAKIRLIMQNQKLVISIAKNLRYLAPDLDLMDFVQYGNIGLIEAINRFDIGRGLRFSTYAVWWIRALIQRNSIKQYSQASISERDGETLISLGRVFSDLSQILGREPTLIEIAESLNIPPKKLMEILGARSEMISFDRDIAENGESGSTMGEYIPDNNYIGVEAEVVQNETYQEIMQAISKLNPKQQELINYRYGFADGKPKTFEEIGVIIGTNRESVRCREKAAQRILYRILNRTN